MARTSPMAGGSQADPLPSSLEPWLLRAVVAKLADKGMPGMLRHKGWSALATATLVGSALAVYVQACPRQPDRKTEAGGTSLGGHIPARASGAGAAEVQPIAEHPEQRLTAREQEFWETLQTTLGQSED